MFSKWETAESGAPASFFYDDGGNPRIDRAPRPAFIQEPRRLSGGEPVMAVWSLLRETAFRWAGHKASLLGAAIAYYSVFSLGPLMVIAIAIAGFVFGDEAARGEVSLELKSLLEHIPAELNRRDSQERVGGRVWRH
jgi:hypothetical protein